MTATAVCPSPEKISTDTIPEPHTPSSPCKPIQTVPCDETNQPTGGGEAGNIIGDYVLGETIGKGTFGKVKLGLHLVTGEKVAIKILEKKKIIEVADVERVAREIKILKRNRHLHVIQLYEVIDSPERIFLIMEHVDGGELFEYIVSQHRIRESEAVICFQQIVEGLAYLHQNEITHRDLKPENVLLQSTKYGPFKYLVKIVDFGLSNTHEEGRLLRTACGSPCYAAPEMIQGKLYKGPMADIWSLGVVLFAMVCGYLPFEDSNTNILYKKILSADYKLPSFLSHNVQDLIRRILETNPEKRITFEMIRRHPWYTCVPPMIPRSLNGQEEGLRETILNQLTAIGLDRNAAMEAIQQKLHNRLTASYYLFYNKLIRQRNETQPTRPTSQQLQAIRRPEVEGKKDFVPVKAPSTVVILADSIRRRSAQEPSILSTRPPTVAPSQTASRRPTSQRSGRHLVLLPPSTQPSSTAIVPTPPLLQRPTVPSRTSTPTQTTRVSVTNGLSPLTTPPTRTKPFTSDSIRRSTVQETSNNNSISIIRKRMTTLVVSSKEDDVRVPMESYRLPHKPTK